MSKDFKFSINLLEDDKVIASKILKAFAEDFNLEVSKKMSIIKNRISFAVMDFIKQTDTYSSLINGNLAAHFGLPVDTRKAMVDNIIQTIGNNIEVEHQILKVRGSGFTGGIEIRILVKDFSDILSMSEAIITTEQGQPLPWLEWLLIKGNKIIISDHEIHLISGKGRSRRGIMVKNNASVWKVPSEYSGVINNNWLTRAISDNVDQFSDTISKILEKELA